MCVHKIFFLLRATSPLVHLGRGRMRSVMAAAARLAEAPVPQEESDEARVRAGSPPQNPKPLRVVRAAAARATLGVLVAVLFSRRNALPLTRS